MFIQNLLRIEERTRELESVKLNSDRKFNELLKHLQKKQDQIDDFLKEKEYNIFIFIKTVFY